MEGVTWNPWHGCHRYSDGCRNCYVFRGDYKRGLDAENVYKTSVFDLPIKKRRDGGYKIAAGQTVWTCFTSDFLLDDADVWREEALEMMRRRGDLKFMFITKRIIRFSEVMPSDFASAFKHVTVGCTVENAGEAARRLPIFGKLPIARKIIVCEPLLGPIDLSPYLDGIAQVVAGGESGSRARVCEYDWVLSLREQCRRAGAAFWFKQTGAYLKKEGKIFAVGRSLQHSQAKKAAIDIVTDKTK